MQENLLGVQLQVFIKLESLVCLEHKFERVLLQD